MFTTKTYIKKNKIGNYIKNVREHYIRDDISCGVPSCEYCIKFKVDSSLDATCNNKSSLFDYNHYLVLDTNIILDQIDVLDESGIGNVIILHTVLNEVKHRSLPTFKHLCTLIEDVKRHYYVFVNDHHKETFIAPEDSELINDYNDRCIRKACTFYRDHLPNEKFVFLTDDAKCRKLAQQENITAISVHKYVKSLSNGQLLEDKLARKDFHAQDAQKEVFPNHLSNAELLVGIREGKFMQGTFRASQQNFLEGFVVVDSLEEPVVVQGRAGLNRSVNGDIVAIRLLPESEWVCPSDIVLEDESVGDENVDEVLLKEKELKRAGLRKEHSKPTGVVVGIIRRKWRQYCGILQGGIDGIYQLFVPSDQSIPKIKIETRQANFLRTQKLIVTIDSWPKHSRYPHGHLVRSLGPIGDKATEIEVILLEHDVPHSKFSEQVLSCLPKLPWKITEEDYRNRVDLRELDVCSVDPPGCTDIDDALHCRDLENGHLEVGVHIADVSHFIRPGTALDVEAASRATTVYLVNSRIHMLPDLISSNLCSLIGGEERFAFSCVWEMSHDAKIIKTRFHKSIIKSKKAMTYEEAQMIIDDKTKKDSLAGSLRNLNRLAKILKKRRMDNGALVLASPEVKIQMDSETMEPLDVEVKKLFETNSMIEEFMLLANISVATKILDEFPECAMLRRHPVPPVINFDPLVKAGRHLGFEICIDSGKNLAASLDAAVKADNPYLNTMLRILATRCMMQAVYFASGTLKKDEFYHYGLAVPLYTHFTSPIRRYADVIVHRLLAVCCGADTTYPDLLDKKKTSDLCQNLNYRNRMAQYAGRASVAYNTHLFFREKVQDEEGYVLYVRKNALQILIPRYGLEGTLFLAKKNESSNIFEYNEEDQTQRSGEIVLHAFDPVVVRLTLNSDNIQHEKIVLQLVTPFIKDFSVSPLSDDGVNGNPTAEDSKKRKHTTSENAKKKKGKNK